MPSIPRPVTTSYIATSQPPSTSHFPNVPIVNIQSSTPSTPTNIQLKVHKWNIHFNGRNDPVTFIERLLEICESQLIPLDTVLPHMPELLQGEAALWFRNNRNHFTSWNAFLSDFRTFYYPLNYLENIEAEIGRRLQKHSEPTRQYVTDLQTLIRRHGGMTSEQETQWIYRNLLPEYRQHIRKTDFCDTLSLTKMIRETELLLLELNRLNRPAFTP